MTRLSRILTPSHIAFLTASALLGCAPQVGPDYAGEPLATIRGVVASGGVASAVEACGWQFNDLLSWQLCADAAVGERIAVQGDFPAAFTLDPRRLDVGALLHRGPRPGLPRDHGDPGPGRAG